MIFLVCRVFDLFLNDIIHFGYRKIADIMLLMET